MPEPTVPAARPATRPPATDAAALARILARAARAATAPWLHQEVARRMADRLPVIKQPPASWIDWWGFTGAGAGPVAAAWPLAQRSVVEPSAALAERSRQALRAPWWAWGERRRDAAQPVWLESQVPAGAAGMLWSNLTLHTATDPGATLAAWHRALVVDGFLMFSTFGPDTLRELRALYRAAGWPAPHPPYVDMHDIGDELVHSGFADPVMDQEQITLTWPTAEAALAELRCLGGNVALARPDGLRTPRWRARLLAQLQAAGGPDGRVALDFEVVYGHAFRPAPRPRLAAETAVPLDDLRAMVRAGRPAR